MQLLENPTSIGQHIKRRRLEQNLKQGEVAMLIGVSEDCITLWENERNRPQINHYPKIIQFLRYNPFVTETETLGGKIKKYRFENGLSIKKLAQMLDIEDRTLTNWENNFVAPISVKCQKLKELIQE
ncbi:MAG: transcriptional regulator [Bacteroidetes bacterium]|nr:transcriptional regulator [Bacteroidota bacterium]